MTPSSAGGPSMDLGDGSAVAGLGSGMDLDAAAGAGAGSAGALSSDSQIFSRGINSLRDLGIKSRRGSLLSLSHFPSFFSSSPPPPRSPAAD